MKKRKKSANRDQTAPRQPLSGNMPILTPSYFPKSDIYSSREYCLMFTFSSGYVRFMNDRREKVRTDNPNISFTEITRLLANEWNQLPQDQKQVNILQFLLISRN